MFMQRPIPRKIGTYKERDSNIKRKKALFIKITMVQQVKGPVDLNCPIVIILIKCSKIVTVHRLNFKFIIYQRIAQETPMVFQLIEEI